MLPPIFRHFAFLLLLAMVQAVPAMGEPLSRDAALARARAIRERVSAGATDPLWADFTPGMRAALRDSANFAVMSAAIHQQLGAIDSVLLEEVTSRDSTFLVSARCRFQKVPIPMVLLVGLATDGRISTLRVRAEAQEYPSTFLDYAPKARFTLPFRGEWLVFWGGRTLGENQHAAVRSQRFAYDIVMVKDGKTHPADAKAITDYYCYGQPILAPADGMVVTATDSLPDQAIGESDPLHAAGNHVVIDHGNSEYSLLAHLQPHSLRVKPGQKVKRGDVLGLAGNSGNTSEPHLHVHLMNKPSMDDADGLPMPFDGYVLDGKVVEHGEPKRFQLVSPAPVRKE
ncbi:MAG: M23 family metallopeptidase [Candidatus Eisenbacteria bacterium]